MLVSLAVALLAGVLSIVSPCVLPILPLVLGAAASEHRLGPMALAGGLAISFVVIGLFIALVGFGLGIDQDWFRAVAAALMIAVGVVLLVPALQTRVAAGLAPLAGGAETRLAGLAGRGLAGQFGIGVLLGAVWAPCVGPTLGAASVLAAQGKNIGSVALTMLSFGIGAAVPLLLLGLLSRQAMLRLRSRMVSAASAGKGLLGAGLVVFGLLILTGIDKRLETALVDASPDWLTELTTRY